MQAFISFFTISEINPRILTLNIRTIIAIIRFVQEYKFNKTILIHLYLANINDKEIWQ